VNNQRKVAMVTGASQGIGAALVQAFRDRDYRIIANSRSIKPSSDPDVLAIPGDIADPAVAERIVQNFDDSSRPEPSRTTGCWFVLVFWSNEPASVAPKAVVQREAQLLRYEDVRSDLSRARAFTEFVAGAARYAIEA